MLNIDTAICVGHSLSGVLATNLAIDHKSLVAGLVLLAPVTHPWPGGTLDLYYRIASRPVWGALFNNLVATPAGLVILRPSLATVFAPQPTPDDYGDRTGVARVLRRAMSRRPTNSCSNKRRG